ncbi:MAG TPA: tetratricopeptide repeat protein, partial [Gammaproteobacteria bacterium]
TRGMGNFFARLQSENRYYGQGAPEFLRTHPVTTSRIAEAEDRARQYPLQLRDNSIHYLLVKARLRLLQADSVEQLQQELAAEAPAGAQEQEAHRYLQALVLRKKGDTDAAHDTLTGLLEKYPGRIAYLHELAELETSRDRLERAGELYRRGLELYPGNEALTLAYADNLMLSGKHDEARKRLEQLLRDRPLSSEGYRLLAKLESDSGNHAASYLAQAEHYYLRGEPHSAIDQLNTAKRLNPLPHYYATRIEARLEQLKDELERHRAEKP